MATILCSSILKQFQGEIRYIIHSCDTRRGSYFIGNIIHHTLTKTWHFRHCKLINCYDIKYHECYSPLKTFREMTDCIASSMVIERNCMENKNSPPLQCPSWSCYLYNGFAIYQFIILNSCFPLCFNFGISIDQGQRILSVNPVETNIYI